MTRRIIPAAVLLTAMTAAAALAQSSAPVEAQNAWARATPPGASTGAVYVTLTAPSGDRLTAASSPVAATTGLHEMHMDGTIMRMNPVPGGLDLPPGKPVTLRPGGYHLMLEGLKAPLRQGQKVPVHLTFQKAPPLDISAQVAAIGAAGPPGMAAGQMDQSAMPGMTMQKSMPGMTMQK